MDAATGNILGLGAGVAAGPLPIVAMILMLATPWGRANGSLFGIGSQGVLAPLIVYLVAGKRAASTLDTWKTWAADHKAAVMAVLFLVFGCKLAVTASPSCSEGSSP